MNEVTPPSITLERIRLLQFQETVSAPRALQVTPYNVFTTTLSVPAGNDSFREMMRKYFLRLVDCLSAGAISFNDPHPSDGPFSMTILKSCGLAGMRMVLTKLHGR